MYTLKLKKEGTSVQFKKIGVFLDSENKEETITASQYKSVIDNIRFYSQMELISCVASDKTSEDAETPAPVKPVIVDTNDTDTGDEDSSEGDDTEAGANPEEADNKAPNLEEMSEEDVKKLSELNGIKPGRSRKNTLIKKLLELGDKLKLS